MDYYSTKNKKLKVDLKEAVFKGLAPDGGLYMPEHIPEMGQTFLNSLKDQNLQETAFSLCKKLFADSIPENELQKISSEALNFDIPLVKVSHNIYSLELFHGPTLAFKDVGARFMARMLSYLVQDRDDDIHILVATSGDTGSAVANGFLGVEGIKVHVLYPKDKVSDIQEMQFTTLGQNITAIEIDGNFDDCQKLVKTAFTDESLNYNITLSSANSINLARLLPQSFYYWHAWKQLEKKENVVFCVPSGNFGNLTAGLIANKMGLPIKHFISATNLNDIVPKYLSTGIFEARKSIPTLANAMDVGNPSNFVRMLDLYQGSHSKMKNNISAFSYSDNQIKDTILQVFEKTGYLLDPHGAIGYKASEAFLKENPQHQLLFFETAHPVKFRDTVEDLIKEKIPVPDRLQKFMNKEKVSITMSKDYEDFRDYLQLCGSGYSD